jgi:hypothetical protein
VLDSPPECCFFFGKCEADRLADCVLSIMAWATAKPLEAFAAPKEE